MWKLFQKKFVFKIFRFSFDEPFPVVASLFSFSTNKKELVSFFVEKKKEKMIHIYISEICIYYISIFSMLDLIFFVLFF